MRVLKILFVIWITFSIFSLRVDAAICDKEGIARLKELASYVDVSYESLEDSGVYNSYYVFITGLTEELYIESNGYNYYYDQVEDGKLSLIFSAGNVEIDVYSNSCQGIVLNKIYLELPKFNIYSLRSECGQLEEYQLKICDKDYQGEITDDYFYKVVNSYLEEDTGEDKLFDNILQFFSNNYLIIVGISALILIIIVAFIRNRKRSVLE